MSAINLLASIQAALGMSVSLGYSSKAKPHDLYEAYVLTLLLSAARAEGWTVSLRDGIGNLVTVPVFRLGPGRLPSRAFTFAHLTKAGHDDIEAHLGVKVSGNTFVAKSSPTTTGYLLHEFDLLVLPRREADYCRIHNRDPTSSSVIILAEMKYLSKDVPLPLARASVGMAVECSLNGKSFLITNRNGYSAQDLVESHGIHFRFRVLPQHGNALYHTVQKFRSFL